MEISLKIVPLSELIEVAYNPERVWSFCSHCEFYDRNGSCPPYDFDPLDYIRDFHSAVILCIDLDDPEALGKRSQVRFYFHRAYIDPRLIKLERKFSGSKSLLPGICRNCSTCHKPCDQSIKRYSLESLGFDVKRILDYCFQKDLSFRDGHLTFVAALLLRSSPNTEHMFMIEEILYGN